MEHHHRHPPAGFLQLRPGHRRSFSFLMHPATARRRRAWPWSHCCRRRLDPSFLPCVRVPDRALLSSFLFTFRLDPIARMPSICSAVPCACWIYRCFNTAPFGLVAFCRKFWPRLALDRFCFRKRSPAVQCIVMTVHPSLFACRLLPERLRSRFPACFCAASSLRTVRPESRVASALLPSPRRTRPTVPSTASTTRTSTVAGSVSTSPTRSPRAEEATEEEATAEEEEEEAVSVSLIDRALAKSRGPLPPPSAAPFRDSTLFLLSPRENLDFHRPSFKQTAEEAVRTSFLCSLATQDC